MPSRPDLRDLTTSVRTAFADADRETLLDVLTFVVQEYVVDGPPPMLMHQAEKLSDLTNLSFAQLISTLQTRLEAPELSLFAVDGEQVSVRIGGVMQPLVMARGGQPAAELPRPKAGVQVVEMPTMPRPASAQPAPQPAQAAQPAQAPRPTQGLSLRGAPTGGQGGQGSSAGNAPPSSPPPASPAAPAAAAPAAPEKPKDSGDDASARFSLLELD
jgi:hypothetical protein